MTKVFVHGNPETSAIWGPLVEVLHRRGINDVVLLSPPGFGAPVPAGWTATRQKYCDWLIAELESLEGPIDLVGHDWGAGHVFSLLTQRPDLVQSWATDCIGLVHPEYVWHDAAQGWQTHDVGEAIVAAMVAMANEDFITSFSQLGMTPEIATHVKQALNDEMGQCILGLYRDAAQPAMVEVGKQLQQQSLPPGLVFIADQDHYAGSVAMMEEMSESLKTSVAQMVGCGHWWMIEQPEQAADALIAHWS